ncbi:beta-glucosidase [Streptomyces fractus]|uniref:beta-glucosidase family protein n=1 Tax=Streptomyces fractus TaxID=641806 RepID=UPI003CF7D336
MNLDGDDVTDAEAETQLTEVIGKLTLEDKVRLVTGQDFWSTAPIEDVGLRSLRMSDGPSGVRGAVWDEREPSLNLPSPTALAASWDRDLARRYGAALAAEARRKDVDVVLGPTINLTRSPRAGRNFESFGEDPVLTAELAVAYIRGVQANGVGATPKHFVANDSETERLGVDVRVSERALREVYLLPFEKAVTEARAWLMMSAYNSVNGTTMTENALLTTPLSKEWGFDGVVVSDWTAVRSLESARAAQDLVMPGPKGPWGDALTEAIRRGEIDEAVLDEKVLRVLRLARRVGALSGTLAADPAVVEDGPALAREVAVEGAVLLENQGELPWNQDLLKSIAVIGDNAAVARTQGGGSATVVPEYTVSPLEGLRTALSNAEVTYALGSVTRDEITPLELSHLTNPVTGEPGVRARFLNVEGDEIFGENRRATNLVYFGGDAPVAAAACFEIHTRYTPATTGPVRLGFALDGHATLYADGAVLVDSMPAPIGDALGANLLSLARATADISLQAGESVDLRLVYHLTTRSFAMNAMSVRLGSEPPEADEDQLIAEAARAAAEADVALVVVGTNARVESEGHDRTSLALPGRQDDLVKAVAAANPHTVVLVNAGAPVLMPWRKDVAGVLVGHFGGQEFGHAIADVLLGKAEPGGRLPTTWPTAETDAPVLDTVPNDGVLQYDEDIHVGHRAWLAHDLTPAYWFGAGQGYAEIEVSDARVEGGAAAVHGGAAATLHVTLHNRSDRSGKQVVQVYAERTESTVCRPRRWLVGFASVRVPAREAVTASVRVDTRLLAHWDEGWRYEPGDYRLRVGTDVVTLPVEVPFALSKDEL